MARNIKYQFKNIIDRHFVEGMDKHSLKASGEMTGDRIFSYADRKNLIDLSSNFSNFMKENYPEVKLLKDIDSNHVQAFLNSKCSECSQQTLAQYQSRFRKLERLAISTYHIEVDYHNTTVPLSLKNGGAKIRNTLLSDTDYTKMLSTTNNNLRNALLLSKHFGLRAAECSKLKYSDIKENGIQIIDSKGKRSRFVPVENQKQKEVLKQFQQVKEGRVCPVQTGSLQQAFNRQAKKQSVFIDNGAFHTLRKSYATEKFQEYRKSGLSVQQSLDKVSQNLGHGSNRNDLMKEYICCSIT